MAILDLQRRVTEAGRIRTGLQETFQRGDGSTGSRPAKLDTFRFTSADKRRIEQIAELYGGKVEAWQAPAGPQWQVVSTRNEIDVIVPPTDLGFSQHYELWSAGGCQRRCDGVTESITEGACLCNPEDRECDIHTRLSVMLRDVPGLGLWRLDTQGWYAAQELIGAVEVLQVAAGRGALLPARLRLDQRQVKRPDKNGKVVTRRFAVPVIDIEITPAQLLAGGQGQPLQQLEPVRAPLTPVPLLAAPVPSIAEQSAAPAARPKRSNAAAEIPASGRSRAGRSTAATAAEQPAEDDGFPDDLFTEPPAVAEPASSPGTPARDLISEIRAAAAESHLEGEPAKEQREALARLFTGMHSGVTLGGLQAVFADAVVGQQAKLSAAQAAAVLQVADTVERDAFRASWTELAGSPT